MTRMDLTRELTYDAPLADVRAMLADPAYWDLVATATGALSSRTTVAEDGDRTTVTTDEQQQVAGVPSFAKKFVGDSTQAIKTFVWDGTGASFEVATPGKPTSMRGTATLAAAGDRTSLTYALHVKASVPLVGGKLEKLVCDLTTEGFAKEHATGQAWLRGER
jgi:hypothetical protein